MTRNAEVVATTNVIQLPGTEPETEIDVENLPGQFDPVQWRPPTGGLSWEQYEKLVEAKRQERNAREKKLWSDLWQLADILNWGIFEFGESFYQLFSGGHYERESLGRIASIGEAFDVSRRYSPEIITFWTHGEVASLDEIDADELLEQYAEGELSFSQLRDAARALRAGREPGASGGKSDATGGQEKLLDTCPLCDGVGEVTPDRRRAYLLEEGVEQ